MTTVTRREDDLAKASKSRPRVDVETHDYDQVVGSYILLVSPIDQRLSINRRTNEPCCWFWSLV